MLQYSYRSGAPVTTRTSGPTDQPWMDYSPIVNRPKIKWPDNARVALWICPCVLYYEFDPPKDPWVDSWARTPAPDVMGYGRQEYGNRVGIWRMLEVLDAHRVKCTGVINSSILSRFPEIRDAIVKRGWDLLGHGMVNTRFIYGFSEDEERSYYREILDSVYSLTGITMKGMGGPGPQAATRNTPDLLAEAGFLYHGDWFCDDQPFPLNVRSGRLIAMPYAVELNDASVLGTAFEADDFLEAFKRQFDQLYREGADNGRVMCVSLHPHLFGQPHRIKYLDAALAYVRSFPEVWHATGAEIAEFYLANYYDQLLKHLQEARRAAP